MRVFGSFVGDWPNLTKPDNIIPDPYKSQSYNRYSYVGNNPVNHSDPTGHLECDRMDEECVRRETGTLAAYLGITSEGEWSSLEIDIVLDAVHDLTKAMGGMANFKTNLDGVTIYKKDMPYGGLAGAHRIGLNANGFSAWTVVHELAHAWWTLISIQKKISLKLLLLMYIQRKLLTQRVREIGLMMIRIEVIHIHHILTHLVDNTFML